MATGKNGRWLGLLLTAGMAAAAPAWAALTIEPITWNVIGLDSNSPASGPFQFPVGARVCAVGTPSNGPVTVTFDWQTGGTAVDGTNGSNACSGGDENPDPTDAAFPNACIFLRGGSLKSYVIDADLTTAGNQAIPAGQCRDAYFEVQVDRQTNAFARGRQYIVTADDADPGTVTTPQPRELFAERLISQNRNSINDLKISANLAPSPPAFPVILGPSNSVNAGASFSVVVGGIYDIRLEASTATQGYEQLETFANFSNAVFRILNVRSTYSADTSPLVTSPSDFLYANGCNWQLSPVLPNYLGCQATGKAGGTITTTYRVQILQQPGGSSGSLNSLVYDYSGSSYHYNADFGSGGRSFVVVNRLTAQISKAFTPATVNENAVSALQIRITNPNAEEVSGYSLVDLLPSGVEFAASQPADPTSAECNTDDVILDDEFVTSPPSPRDRIRFGSSTPGVIPANSTCVITVNVVVPDQSIGGTVNGNLRDYQNVTDPLLVGGASTGLTASATLSVGDTPPVQAVTCDESARVTLATWIFDGEGTTTFNSAAGPNADSDSVPGTPTAAFVGYNNNTESFISTVSRSVNNPVTGSWRFGGNGLGEVWPQSLTNNGSLATDAPLGRYAEFSLDTSGFSNIRFSGYVNYLANNDWGSQNQQQVRIYSAANRLNAGSYGAPLVSITNYTSNNWNGALVANAPTSGATTHFALVFGGASNGSSNRVQADALLDDVVISGCPIVTQPTITKAFEHDVIGVSQSTTLTFIIRNESTTLLTGVNVTDVLPAGLTVVNGSATGCGGTVTMTAPGTIALSGGTIAAGPNTQCQFSVTVTGATAGLKQNVSGAVDSAQTAPNESAAGRARADLLVLAPPVISKSFSPNPIAVGGTSRLTFTITNPNTGANATLAGIGFADTLPDPGPPANSPGDMDVASPVTGNVNNCSMGSDWSTPAGGDAVQLSGATLAPGASCTVSVLVSAPVAGTYNNASGPVSHVVNPPSATPLNGNTANASLTVDPLTPGIALQKRVAVELSPGIPGDEPGPWGEFVSAPPGARIYFQFTIENTGSVELARPATGFWITDSFLNPLPLAGFCPDRPTLPVADALDDDHIYECVVPYTTSNPGPETVTNTATVASATAGIICQTIPPAAPNPLANSKCVDTASFTTRLPDIRIAKQRTVPAGAIINGTNPVAVTWDITLSNLGPSSTVNNTLAPIVIEDELLPGISYTGYSSTDPGWFCTVVSRVPPVPPRDLVRCTYSNVITSPLAVAPAANTTVVRIHALVATTVINASNQVVALGGGDPQCTQTVFNDADVTCRAQTFDQTVPVTLSHVQSSLRDGVLDVRFTTVAEAGTIGYRVLQRAPGTTARAEADIILARAEGLMPETYVSRSAHQGGDQFWIEEIESTRRTEIYGPYRIGVESGREVQLDVIDWAAIQAEQRSLAVARQASLLASRSGVELEARINVTQSGPVRVTHEALLAAGIDWSGVEVARIAVHAGREPVAAEIDGPAQFGPGSAIRFLGKGVEDDIYTRTRSYRIGVATEGTALRGVYARPSATATPVTVVRDWTTHAPNRIHYLGARWPDPYAMFTVNRPADTLVGVNEPFVLRHYRSGNAPDQVEVVLWSQNDLPHALRFLLNGTAIGELRFTGIGSRVFQAEVPAGVLVDGSNTLRVESLPETGQVDIIRVESLKVLHHRELRPVDGAVVFADRNAPGSTAGTGDRILAENFESDGVAACTPSASSACTVYRVAGLPSSNVSVLRERNGSVERLSAVSIGGAAGNHELTFATLRQSGDVYRVQADATVPASQLAASPKLADPLAFANAPDYLIISHESFVESLAPMVTAKQAQGFRVGVVTTERLYDWYSGGVLSTSAIRSAVQDAVVRHATRYVLLVGNDTRDPLNFNTTGSISFLPTNYRNVDDRITFAPTDVPYADVDGDGRMDVALGRWPVRTVAEVGTMTQKTLAYGEANHTRKALLVADRRQGEAVFSDMMGVIPTRLGANWQVSRVNLENYPATTAGTSAARSDLVAAVNGGQALMAFMGHGAPLSWTREGLIGADLLNGGLFSNAGRPTVVWGLGCYMNFFVQPQYNSVAHALLVRNSSGAAALIGGSTLTRVEHDDVWMAAMSGNLAGRRIGDAFVSAQNQLAEQHGESLRDIWLGASLLGDPALVIKP